MDVEARNGELSPTGIELEQPLLVGNYELFRLLGEGGLASTYLGRDLDRGRLVAVKAIPLLRSRRRHHLERFEREAGVLKALRHPQIPAFYETVVEEGAEILRLFLVQEFVAGHSLQQRLREGHLFGAPEVVSVLLSCLEPLSYLQELDPPVFHRDIKPSNIVQRADGTCVLVDFGAVREALTDPGLPGSNLVGTVGYMAPEQLQGHTSSATDLYALGASALHLLSGRPPREFPLKRLKPHFHGTLNVDSHLAAILDLLLEPVAEDRYQTVTALRRALERWVSDHREDFGRVRRPPHSGSDPALPVTTPADLASRDTSDSVTRSPIIMVDTVEEVGASAEREGVSSGAPERDTPGAQQDSASTEAPSGPSELPDAFGGDWAAGAAPALPPSSEASAGSEVALSPPMDEEARDTLPSTRPVTPGFSVGPGVAVSRVSDRWSQLLDPTTPGYARFGGIFIAMAVILVALGHRWTVTWVAAGALAAYGLSYFLFAWLRRRAERPKRLLGSADGTLLSAVLRTTVLGQRYVVLHYEFQVGSRHHRGHRFFASRKQAIPFLRRDLPGMVWYDEENPARNTLDLP